VGWKGSAHVGRVLQDAFSKGFNIPHGKYFLGDAGYGLSDKVLIPYWGVHNHLQGSGWLDKSKFFYLKVKN
jgi:hypothetical protein